MFESLDEPSLASTPLLSETLGGTVYDLRNEYYLLRETQAYNADKQLWTVICYDSDSHSYYSDFRIDEQLLDVVFLTRIEPAEARRRYQELSEKTDCPWKRDSDGFLINKLGSGQADMDMQLLDIFAQCSFDRDVALRNYRTLTELGNYADGFWYRSNEDITSAGPFLSEDQLLGVCVEAQFDLQAASERYDALSESDLYDNASGLWQTGVRVDGSSFNFGESPQKHVQLLGLMALACLASDGLTGKFCELERRGIVPGAVSDLRFLDRKTRPWGDEDQLRSGQIPLLSLYIRSFLDSVSSPGSLEDHRLPLLRGF